MRHVREVLRLKFVGGVPTREIARRIGVAASTVRTPIGRFQAAGLSWPLPEELTDAALEARLFPDAGTKQGHRRQVEPDWASIHRELKRKHVTLSILWDEYIARDPEGYRYSRFCELYRIWEGKLSVTMRQTHVGGDKLFVDYAGDTVRVRLRTNSKKLYWLRALSKRASVTAPWRTLPRQAPCAYVAAWPP
jgi:transposase